MTDVLLQQTPDGGEINYENGELELTGDFRTTAYLLLFGGNERDDGRDENPLTWWGNRLETDPNARVISRTEALLTSLPAVSANLLRLEDAALRDLEPLRAIGAATRIEVAATIPDLNKIRLTVTINGDETVEFLENWKANQ